MDKILEALGNLIPGEQVKEVAEAVKGLLDEARQDLNAEFETKLEQAYEQLTTELKSVEATAEEGYQQAYSIIQDLRTRLEVQQEEFKQALEEGYEEAYQMLKKNESKTDSSSMEIYEEYNKKLEEMKEYMVDKIDAFLQYKGGEMFEYAKREILHDPRMVEHKVALDKIVDITSNYLSDDVYSDATSGKLEEAHHQLHQLKGQIQVLEHKNINLNRQNNKLNEQVKEAVDIINEQNTNGKKERVQKAENARGRGQRDASGKVQLIAEYNNNQEVSTEVGQLAEQTDEFSQWRQLAGLENS